MTNELEKQFFDTFGIEPKYYCGSEYIFKAMLENECTDGNLEKCKTCEKVGRTYPQITDRILLELIFLQPLSIEFKYPRNIEELKNTLLGYYIEELSLFAEPSEAEIFKQKVQTLFKEEN